jgi:hypothetical protein
MTTSTNAKASSSTKIIGSVLAALIVACLLLMVTGYRVLVGEEKSEPQPPDLSGPPETIQLGNVQVDARLIPALTFVRCRYFTGRSFTSVSFSTSQIDSCPFLYRPKAYERL